MNHDQDLTGSSPIEEQVQDVMHKVTPLDIDALAVKEMDVFRGVVGVE
jgi:hypothetical protein